MEITTETRLKEVLKLNEFTQFGSYLNCSKGICGWCISQVRIRHLGKMWNAQSICDGFSYMQSLCRQGRKLFIPVYNEEEILKHPDLRERVIFHFPAEQRAKFVVICAGGSYGAVCSMAEAFPTAKRLNEMGYHAFVINYRVGKYACAPNPQEDLANAIRYILEHAEELGVETQEYAVCGFSAGGHLAASFGTEALGYKHYDLPKPEILFLAYPVITMGENTHKGSCRRLLGWKNIKSKELIYRYSIEKQVTQEYPSCFIWQCEHDREVSIENSQLFVKALDKYNIPYIYRTYPGDGHGWGLGEGTAAEGWLRQAVKFWEGQR